MSAWKFLLRGCVEPTTKSTTRFAYAEYRARTTCSAEALAYVSSLVWRRPQHFIYPSDDPQGHGSVAAAPKPAVGAFILDLFFFVFFFLDAAIHKVVVVPVLVTKGVLVRECPECGTNASEKQEHS
eukprot:scaffold40492_cov56-Attheya_sp.AAC.2